MKKSLKLFSLFSLFGGLLAVGGALSRTQEVRPVEAAGDLPTETVDAIKIKVNNTSNWGDPPLTMDKVHYFNISTTGGYTLAETAWPGADLAVDGTYEFPWFVTEVTLIIRGYQKGQWDDKQTNDITISSPGLYTYEIDGNGTGDPWRLTYTQVKSAHQVERYITTEGHGAGIDETRTRIWLDRGHYGTSDAFSVLHLGDSLYKPSGYESVGPSNKYLAYYDVPLADLSADPVIQFLKIKNDLTTVWNTSTSHTYVAGDSSKLFKLPSSSGDTLSVGPITERISASFFRKVLEGYLTCSPSLDNGYGAFNTMDANFLPRSEGLWNMEGDLGGTNISDYAGTGVEGYSDPRGTGVEVDAYEKYIALQNMSITNADPTANIKENYDANDNVLVILSVVFIGVAAAAGAYYFKFNKAK